VNTPEPVAEAETLGDFQVLHVGPGDVLVLRTAHHVSEDTASRIRHHMLQYYPNNKVLVLGDMEVGVLSARPLSCACSGRLEAIEKSLAVLVEALAAEDAADEEAAPSFTLDGQPSGRPRDPNAPL
jgi:hypothetical protein